MGTALDRLADRLAFVEFATRVQSHLRKTKGGITDVEAYYREYGHIFTKRRGRLPSSLRQEPRRGESGYLQSPKRYTEHMGPSPSRSARLLKGTSETRLERLDRLRKKLVDYKADRPLEGGEDIREVIPGTEVQDYMSLPFLNRMHEAMGIDVDTVTTEEYTAKRNALFSPENTTDEEVSFDGLVTTQQVVNRDKARRLVGAKFDPPPYVVRYRGTEYVINGHHRVVAEALAGKSGTRARVLDIEP